MSALRILFIMAVALWLGGWLALAAISAPVLFRSLSSRTQAASLFGEMARRWGVAETALSLVILAAAALLFFRSAPGGAVRLALAATMSAIWVAHGVAVWPRAVRLQAEIGTFDRDPGTDEERALRARFRRLHRLSTGLLAAQLLAGAALLAWEAVGAVE